MNRIIFFLKLNHKNKSRSILLFIVFLIAASVLSSSLLIRKNNRLFYEAQLSSSFGDSIASAEEFRTLSDSIGAVLSVLSICGVIILIWGALVLFLFRDLCMRGTYAICRIYGMHTSDIYFKAAADTVIYGILSGIPGSMLGYLMFALLSKRLSGIGAGFSIFSFDVLSVLALVTVILVIVSGMTSLVSGMFVFEKKIVNIFYERNETSNYKKTIYTAISGLFLCYLALFISFGNDIRYLKIVAVVIAVPAFMLFVIFRLVFTVGTKKYRNRKNPVNIRDLSFRFLCTKHKRDAILAATVSVGAILICFIMNIEFNIDGILRDAYRDNLGYSTGIRVDGIENAQEISKLLDDNGYLYTQMYSNLMNYSDLNGCENMEGQFWIALVGKQTADNAHFFVEKGCFKAVNHFIYLFSLIKGNKYDFFGNDLYFTDVSNETQALSLINYNVIMNIDDYGYSTDSSWSVVYLLDINKTQEQNLAQLLKNKPCKIETASSLISELNNLLGNYLLFAAFVGIMLVMVTAAFFYSIIKNDIEERRRELYLYKVFGGSQKKSMQVIFGEYIMVALVSSLSVVFVIMALREIYFMYMLKRHYPLSIVVTVLTTLIVTAFVMLCCHTAQRAAQKSGNITCLRDE